MSVLGEIKFVTERLIRCEGNFTGITGAIAEVGKLRKHALIALIVYNARLSPLRMF